MQSGVLAFSCHFSRLQIQSETFADNNHHTCFAGSFLLFNPYRSLEHEQMSGNNTKTKSFELCALMTDFGLMDGVFSEISKKNCNAKSLFPVNIDVSA